MIGRLGDVAASAVPDLISCVAAAAENGNEIPPPHAVPNLELHCAIAEA